MIRLIPIGVALAVVVAIVLLAGCAGAPAVKCPLLVQYPQLEQDALAGELPSDGPESQRQIEDYVKLRQACQASAAVPHP